MPVSPAGRKILATLDENGRPTHGHPSALAALARRGLLMRRTAPDGTPIPGPGGYQATEKGRAEARAEGHAPRRRRTPAPVVKIGVGAAHDDLDNPDVDTAVLALHARHRPANIRDGYEHNATVNGFVVVPRAEGLVCVYHRSGGHDADPATGEFWGEELAAYAATLAATGRWRVERPITRCVRAHRVRVRAARWLSGLPSGEAMRETNRTLADERARVRAEQERAGMYLVRGTALLHERHTLLARYDDRADVTVVTILGESSARAAFGLACQVAASLSDVQGIPAQVCPVEEGAPVEGAEGAQGHPVALRIG